MGKGGTENRFFFRDESVRMHEHAIKTLKKAKDYESNHTLYEYRFPNGLTISHVNKERLEEIKSSIAAQYGYKL